jgi:RNA polymerase sigma factor (sigma-70 family)
MRHGDFPETTGRQALSNRVKETMLRRETDIDLIEQSLEGSGRAFKKLVERYYSLVYSVVRGIIGNRDEVEDVTQEVFIKVYRKLATFRGEARLSTWIYRIARNEAINVAKRARPDAGPLDEADRLASDIPGPDRRLEQRITASLVEELLSSLDEQYRVVLELRYMGEKSYAEIAEIMEIPIGTVKTYIHRGKALLRQRLIHRKQKEGA